MALSALSGCVTVQRPPVPGPPAAVPSPPSAPRPDGLAGTQVVQAPAREALEMVGPSRKPAATTLRQRQRQPATGAAPAERPPSSHSHQQHHRAQPRPAHPDPRRHARPHVDIPDVEAEVHRNTDVCALGRKYGGWRGDSPEAVICEQAYGR
ncbi:hypothetical protein [Streptomyces sp. NPDC096132]|uniref:hypothetical protein n=1 Tax=Streptomyces sp. NPDC096132 TaxID=3366075 RepID=UPI0037F156CC